MIAPWVAGLTGALLVATWLGYPGLMWLRARLRPDPLRPDATAGRRRIASVILATRATPSAVLERVRNLAETAHPLDQVELIVAWDGGRSEGTLEDLRRSLEQVPAGVAVRVVLSDPPGGKAAALNAGVRAARGDRLVFADTAQRFDRDTIPALIAALEDARFGAVSGVLHLPDDASPLRVYWALERFLRRQEAVVHSSIGVTGAVYAMPRDAWTPVPAGTLLDDVWVPMQLVLNGWRVGVAPGARAWDVRSFGAQDEVTRKTRTQTGVLQLLSLMPALLTATNPVRGCFIWHKLARLLTPLLVMMLGLAAVITAQPALAALDPTWWFATAMVCSLLLLVPRARRALWTWGRYLLGMQWALLQAARMASRGQWGVWRPTDQ